MRCKQCGEYIPEGLGLSQCFCGAELSKETLSIDKENDLTENKSKAIEQKAQIVTKSLTQKQKEQIDYRIDRLTAGVFKKNLIWVIATIIAFFRFLRFAIGGNTTNVAMLLLICFLVMAIFLIFIFIYSIKNIHKLKKDLEGKKAIVLSAEISSIEELKGGGKKGYEYEIYLEKNEANIEKVHFFSDNSFEFEKGDHIKLTLTPNAHFVLAAERNVKPSFKRERYDKSYITNI